MANHPNRVNGYARSSTSFRGCTDALGRRISYIVSDECTVIAVGVHSIHDPRGNRPSFRRVLAGDKVMGEADEPIPSHGLVVLGTSKFDRPGLDAVEAMTDIDGAAAVAAIRVDLAATK